MPRALDGGASGPEAFTLPLRLPLTHFDRVNTGKGYTKLHAFGVCNGTHSFHFSREFRVLVSAVTGSERVLSPGTDVVLEVVRMAVNEQFPTLMPTLYPGSKATDPRPYASLDAMWKAFSDLAHNMTPAVNGEKHFFLHVFRRDRGNPLRRGPGQPFMGAARAECRPSRLLGRRVVGIIRLPCRLLIPPTPGSTKCPTTGP